MNRRQFVGRLGAVLPAAGFVRRWPPGRGRSDDQFVERWSWAMGQPVHLMIYATSEAEGLDACAAALAELRRVESRLTLFDDASDICELNRLAGRRSMWVDRELRDLLALAGEFRQATGGGFNVAVEPLMRAWGFHQARTSEPTRAEIEEARDAVAAAVIELDGDVARLPSAHTKLDFGGIGVGFGIDRALAVLRERGIRRAFIDVSGDCAALEPPPGEDGWKVAIADPDHPGRTVGETKLANSALATSANTESVLRYGRTVLGHVMNPATGFPARSLRQVTVIAKSASAADALSTGMLVSGRRPAGALKVFPVR